MYKRRAAVTALLSAVALAGCEPSATVTPGTPFNGYGLTTDYFTKPDGTQVNDTLIGKGTYEHFVVSAPSTNQGGNSRVAFTHYGAPNSVNEEICVTFDKSQAGAQPGLMLRFDGHDGIGFTQNIIYGVYDSVNLHYWSVDEPHFTAVQGWSLPGLTGKAFPWQMCARAENTMVRFRLWPMSEPDPGYSNPSYSGSATVTVMHAGMTGVYAGHISAGNNITYQFNGEVAI